MNAIASLASLLEAAAFLSWLTGVIASTMIGGRKGAGVSGFLLGLVFGPFGVIIALAMVGERTPCPFCRELVRFQATMCPRCQSPLKAAPPAPASPSSDA